MEEFSLNFDNIMDASELFSDDVTQENENVQTSGEEESSGSEEDNEIPAEGLKASDFVDSESVGGENTSENDLGNAVPPAAGSSPDNTYSSIASAFKIDGVPLFSDADDEKLNGLQSADDFEEFISSRLKDVVESRLTDAQKRIDNALTYGMNPSDIQIFENSIKNLDSISDADLTAETERGEAIRRDLILTDLTVVRGYTEAKAKKKVEEMFAAGTDVDEAQDALDSCKKFYSAEYQRVLNEQKKIYDDAVAKQKAAADKLKKDILDGDKAFGEVKVDANTRQKIFDAISKPVAKDANGNPITAIQKYADENPVDFRKNLAYFYVITDGFKSLERVKDAVKNEVTKKQISALEQALNSTARNEDGSLRYFNPTGFGDTATQGWQIEL